MFIIIVHIVSKRLESSRRYFAMSELFIYNLQNHNHSQYLLCILHTETKCYMEMSQ
jgi:hypothetical protein